MSGCCNTLSVSGTDSVSVIRVWVTETELVSETPVCVNHLIQVSARDDPAESYAIVCSQQWTDLNISRMYCTIQCKTGKSTCHQNTHCPYLSVYQYNLAE